MQRRSVPLSSNGGRIGRIGDNWQDWRYCSGMIVTYLEHIHLIVLRSVIVSGRIPWGEAVLKTSSKMSCPKKSDGCIAKCHDWDWNLQARLLQLEYQTKSHTKHTAMAHCLPHNDDYGGCQGIASGPCGEYAPRRASECTLKSRSSPDS